MSLGLFSHVDMDTYLTGTRFDGQMGPLGGNSVFIPNNFADVRNSFVWIDKLGLFQGRFGESGLGDSGITRFDPLLIDNSSSAVGFWTHAADLSGVRYFCISAFAKDTGDQRMFGVATASNEAWKEMPLAVPGPDSSPDAFPNAWSVNPSAASGITIGTNGYYDADAQWVFFPDWGDGYAIVPNCNPVRQGGVNYANVTAQINLSTGAATIIDIPSYFTPSPVNEFQRGRLLGETGTVQFIFVQFIPDDDSTGVAPKGRLFMTTDGSLQTSGVRRYYFQFVDFNPLNVQGTPVRVHERIRLQSRFDVDTAGFVAGTNNTSSASTLQGFQYNPITNLIAAVWSANPTLNRAAGDVSYMQVTPQPGVSILTRPQGRTQVTTNRVVTFASEARGDLGELVAGVDVNWTLQRISTRGEVLATTPTPGETVTVANVPITRGPNFPFDVYEDGVALVETTDYTVNAALGQITFIAPKPLAGGEVYTIDYAHTSTPATPAIGDLITPTAVTDANGEAFARVDYADEDLNVGFLDRIDVDDN